MSKYSDKKSRNERIVMAYIIGGFDTRAIAKAFSVSVRTIQRVLKEAGVER